MIDVGSEGDPIMLAQARTKNYSDSKIGIFSSPTVEGISTIWRYFESGTMGKWSWPCPRCSEYFVPEFKYLWWPKDCTPEAAQYDARLVCPNCGGQIENHEKEQMNAAGRYLYHQHTGDKIEPIGLVPNKNPNASFWISGICSPWQSFGDIANVMLVALKSKNQSTIQAAINTYLGELYRQSGDAPRWEDVAKLRQDYMPDTPPPGVQVITCGVDVQKDGLYYVIRGWGFNSESWRLGGDFIPGQTEFDGVWLLLTRVLEKKFGGMAIRCTFIDSGYRPGDKTRRPDHMVYKYARQYYGKVFPTKGHDTQDSPLKVKKIDITLGGKQYRGGLQLWHIDTDYFKTWVHSRIRWPENQSGGWHVERRCDDEYCKQVTAEEVLILPSGRRVWRTTRADNHYLDCEVLAAAAATRMQVHTLRDVLKKNQAETATAEEKERFPNRKDNFIGRRRE